MPSATPRLLEGLRILIVEDEPDTLSFLSLMLKQQGVVVQAARSADEAMRSLDSREADILVSDIGMPGEDGFDLIRRVRTREVALGLKPMAAIALTAYAGEDHRQRALADGYHAHLAKPAEPTELLALLASLAPAVG